MGEPLKQRRGGERQYFQKSRVGRGVLRTAKDRRGGGPERPDADYNFAMNDPGGRRLMPLQYLHPMDGHVPDENNMVDLSPLCGTLVRMLLKGARIVWSCDMPIVNRFVESGAVQVAPGYEEERYKYVLVDPAWSTRDVFKRFELAHFKPGTLEGSAEYLAMRNGCRIPGFEMPSAKALDGAFAVQRQTGHYSRSALLAHFPVVPCNEPQIHREMNARLQRLRLEQIVLDDGHGVTHEELSMLVPVLVGLRESYFAGRRPQDYREPSERSRKLLWSLEDYRVAGCIFAYAVLGTARRDETTQGYIAVLKRFEKLAREVVPDFNIHNPWHVARALNHVAFSKQLDGRMGNLARYNICQAVRIILGRTSSFCNSKLSSPSLRAEAPAKHAQDHLYVRRLRRRYEKLRPAMRAKRKSRSDEVARRYDRVVDGAAFRAKQIARDGEAGRAALAELLKPKNADRAFRQFEVEDDELDAEGLPTGRKLTKTWKCWRIEVAWASMRRPDASVRENGHSVHYRAQRVETLARAPHPFIFELVDVQRDDGEDPILPWYVRLGDALFFTGAGNMTIEQRLRRHELCREMKLPDYRGTAESLLNFERDRSTLARIGMGLEKPRRFFPLEEFDHAMMLAAHGLDTVVQTWCRPHEALQQTAYQQDWERPEEERNELDPEDDRGFLVHCKVARLDPNPVEQTFMPCSDTLYVSAMRIVALMKHRWFQDGSVPITAPRIAAWKLGPQPWIFSTPEGHLRYDHLSYFVRVLLAGIADATLHDFRHAGSHRANKVGVILTLIKAGLGQRSERLARYYSRLCLEDRQERSRQNAEKRRREAAAMRAQALSMEKMAA